jgi:DeoR family fructose operon transcriptional repressor
LTQGEVSSVLIAERRRLLLEQVHDRGYVSFRELAEALGISESTVRRDLRSMVDDGLVIATRGGVGPLRRAPGRAGSGDGAGSDGSGGGHGAQTWTEAASGVLTRGPGAPGTPGTPGAPEDPWATGGTGGSGATSSTQPTGVPGNAQATGVPGTAQATGVRGGTQSTSLARLTRLTQATGGTDTSGGSHVSGGTYTSGGSGFSDGGPSGSGFSGSGLSGSGFSGSGFSGSGAHGYGQGGGAGAGSGHGAAGGSGGRGATLDREDPVRDEREAIAAQAVSLIVPGTAILLGPGRTTTALARRLAGIEQLTVVTNSVAVTQALIDLPQIDVVLVGGALRRSIGAVVGPITEQALQGLRGAQVFLSGEGVTAARGLTTPNVFAAATDQALMAAGRQVVVLADHTKIGFDTMCQTVPTDRIDVLVTDGRADADTVRRLRAEGVDVRVA